MWTPRDIARRRWLRAGIMTLALGLPQFAAAAPRPQSSEPSSPSERRGLRQAIEGSFEALPVSGGLVLRPLKPLAGVKSIEIKGPDVAVNGERVNPRTLQDWLGDRAEPVLRLQRMRPQDRLSLLGLPGGKAGAPGESVPLPGERESALPPPPAPPAAPEAPETIEPPEAEEGQESTEPAEPAEAEEPSPVPEIEGRRNSGDRVNIGGGVTVDRGERAEKVVAIGGPARVEGEVEQDVISVGNSVHVDGKVGGEVVSVGGSVYLGPHAEIDGNVTTVGGSINREQGAVIHGTTSEVSLFRLLRDREGWRRHGWGGDFSPWRMFGGFGDFLGSLTGFVFLSLLACLVILIARQPLERVLRQLKAQPWQAAGVGFAAVLTFWPLLLVVTALLAITIVGCLLFALYPFAAVFICLVMLVGYTAVAVRIGEAVEHRFDRQPFGPYVAALVGVFLLHVPSIFSSLFDWIGGPLHIFSFVFGVIGFLAALTAWIVGFGAVIMARFGTSPGYWPRAGAPVVPGVPVVPAYPGAVDGYGVPVVPEQELPLSHSDSEDEPPAR